MNTNDEQAKYKATQKKAIVDMMRDAEADGLYDEVPRAPMFKLEDVKCAMKAQGWSCSDDEARKALHFIEAKITSGELLTREQAKKMAEDAVEDYKDELASEWLDIE